MYRSHRRHRLDEEDHPNEKEFEYLPGDRFVFESPEGLNVCFKLRILADLLQCPLCTGFFREACTIKECLHTFCKSCILKFTADGGEFCPLCNSKLSCTYQEGNVNHARQQQSLPRMYSCGAGMEIDRTIQNLVDKMFPFFAENERLEKYEVYKFCGIEEELQDSFANPSLNSVSTQHSSSSALPHGPASASYSNKPTIASTLPIKQAKCVSDGTEEFFVNIMNNDYKLSEMQNMALALFPDNDSVKPLSKSYIRTSNRMQVEHLMRYLASKLGIENHLCIELTLEDRVVAKSHTLDFVCRSQRLDPTKCILFKYRINLSKGKAPLFI